MAKISFKELEKMKIAIAIAAVSALDFKLQNKNYDYEEIIPLVLRKIRVKERELGVLAVASASRALKHYNSGYDYKSSVAKVLSESEELIGLLDDEVA